MNHLHTQLLLAAVALGAPLSSQSPTAAAFKEPARELADAPHTMPWPDHALTDVAADGTIWAGAESWKASFAANGATFHPFLGGDAPAAAATFALHAARCGGLTLSLVAAAPTLAGQQVRYERGALRERFDLTTRGIEQQFVFDELPRRGELQLDVDVSTDLTIAVDANGHTLLGENGGLRYGRATAFDANGNTCALATTFVDGAFHITVPAAFVAHAALPLVVDPLIGTIHDVTASSTLKLTATDIAYDQSLGQFFVCYERAYSATDHDVYVVYTDSNLTPQGLLTIDFTSSYWTHPRVATLEAHDTGCVVAQTSTGNVSPFAVKARIFLGGQSPLVQPVTQISNGGFDFLAPDIGGDADATGPSHFLVAYEGASTPFTHDYVRLQWLDAIGTVTYDRSAEISFVGRLQGVAVSKTCGAVGGNTECWAVLFRNEANQQTIGKLQLAFANRDGSTRIFAGGATSIAVSGLTPNAGSEWDVSSPTNDDTGRTVLCAETRVDQVTGKGSIHGTAVDWLGSQVVPDTVLVDDTYDHRTPVVDSDGYRFVLGYERAFSVLDHDVRLKMFSRVGSQLLQADEAYTSLLIDLDTQPAICAMGGGHNQYAIAWSHSNGSPWTIQAQRYDSIGHGLFTTRATGCGPVGMGITGSATIGQSFTMSVSGTGGFLGMLAGTAAAVPIGPCPGCILGVDGALFAGNQLPVAVPFEPSFLGATISFQGVQIDFAAASCLGLFQLADTWDVTVL